jgi:hypothetical protein
MSHYTHDATANNNAHLGATSARDGETLSAGSTANGRMTDHHNGLEKDFSRNDGKYPCRLIRGTKSDSTQVTGTISILITVQTPTLLCGRSEQPAVFPSHPSYLKSFTCRPKIMSRVNYERLSVTPRHCKRSIRQVSPQTNARSALIGFLLSLTPLSWTLMGWRGAGGSGAASIGWYFFAGGMLMVLGGIGEVCAKLDCLRVSHVTDAQ